MGRRYSVRSGGGGLAGVSSQLAAGDGSAVTVGSGLSLSGGTLTAPGYKTVHDYAWSADSGTTHTNGTQTTNGSIVWNWVIQAGTSAVSDAKGLKLSYVNGFYAGPLANLSQSALSSSALGGRWRWWARYQNASGGSRSATIIHAASATDAANWFGVRVLNASVFVDSGVSTSINSNGTAAWRTTYDVLMVEHDGASFTVRFGVWSGGWPSVGSMMPFYMWTPSATDLNTLSGAGLGLSTNWLAFWALGTGTSSTYLYNTRIDLAP